ncbi:hypothetical protein N9S00_07025 [Luminiphilus sp.]|nr:hypothetical protein [Luminiphilus sp.]
MTEKQRLESLLPEIAKSVITADGVEGNFCTLTPEDDGTWDVWIRHKDFGTGEILGTGKVNNILRAIDLPARRLTGEAILNMTSEQIMTHRKVLGLKKRRLPTRGGFQCKNVHSEPKICA